MIENPTENTATVNESVKLVKWATVSVNDLEILPEDDLRKRFEDERAAIGELGDTDANAPEVLEILSNFSSLCFAMAQHFSGKCNYYKTLGDSLNDEMEEVGRENEELIQSRQSLESQLEDNKRKTEREKESLSESLKQTKEDLSALNNINLELRATLKEKETEIKSLEEKVEQLSISRSSKEPKEYEATTKTPTTGVRRGLPSDWSKICKNLTPFNPEVRPNAGIEEFIATLNGKLSVRQPPYSDDEKLSILKMVIEGTASVQLQSYSPETQNNFKKLCAQLEKDFGRFSCQEAAIEALRGREGKQKTTETPSEFLRRLQRLSARAFGKNFQGRDDVTLRLAFVDGLQPHIRQPLEALAINNLDDLVAKAEIFHHKRTRPKDIQVCEVKDLNLEGASMNRRIWPNRRDGPRRQKKGDCFRCGEPGHHARECHNTEKGIFTTGNPSVVQHQQTRDTYPKQDGFMEYMKKMIEGYEKQTGLTTQASIPQAPVAQISKTQDPIAVSSEQ